MRNQTSKRNLARNSKQQEPPIPEKLYFTIGEVSDLCDLKPHVLRYWEQEFPQLKPIKRRGNRRYYRREDVLLIRQIKDLLYIQGYTIEGARQQLATEDESKEPARHSKVYSTVHDAVVGLEEIVAELEDRR